MLGRSKSNALRRVLRWRRPRSPHIVRAAMQYARSVRTRFGRRLRDWFRANGRDLPVAPHARSVSRARVRADASADASGARRRAIWRLPARVSHAGERGALPTCSRHGGVVRTRILRACAEPSRAGARGHARTRACFRRIPPTSDDCPVWARTPRARWRRLRTSGARRWWTRTSRACCAACSRRASTLAPREGAERCGRSPMRFSLGPVAPRGRTTRRSWSWVRWSARRASRTATSAPFDRCAGPRTGDAERAPDERSGGAHRASRLGRSRRRLGAPPIATTRRACDSPSRSRAKTCGNALEGPFGAAIVEEESGRLVAVGMNQVVPRNNAILHAEIVAFMFAQQRVGSYTLGGRRSARAHAGLVVRSLRHVPRRRALERCAPRHLRCDARRCGARELRRRSRLPRVVPLPGGARHRDRARRSARRRPVACSRNTRGRGRFTTGESLQGLSGPAGTA